MPRSNPVIRRYTPPTCTLEVLAENSPLSKWMNKSVLKQVRFELRLLEPQTAASLPDKPHVNEDGSVIIRGDRDQLEALSTAVRDYVQRFIQTPPDSFWDIYGNKSSSEKTIQDSPGQAESKTVQQKLPSTAVLNNQYLQNPGSQIHLQPSNYLSHNLFLGNLSSSQPHPSVKLSLLQLFDLASALDQYSSDVVSLPVLNEQSSKGWRIPNWAPVAAVLAVSVGLTPLTINYVNNTRRQQTANQVQNDPADQQIALKADPEPTISPTPTTPLPTLEGLPSVPPPGATVNVPSAVNTPIPQVSPNTSIPTPGTTPNTVDPNQLVFPTNAPGVGGNINIPNTVPAPPTIASAQLPNTSTTRQSSSSTAQQYTPPTPGSLPPEIANLPRVKEAPPTTGTTSVAGKQPANSPVPNDTVDTSELIRRIREGKPVATAENTAIRSSDSTLFDTPQIAEARQFLSKRWQVPAGLKQSLEYSLTVGVDGTIERILPLGSAARTYVDRTGIPLIGEKFVSPNRNGQSVRIRVVFRPNGKVETFPDND